MKIESYSLSTDEVIVALQMWESELFDYGNFKYSLIPDYDAMAINGESLSRYIEKTGQTGEWSKKKLQEARDFLNKCKLDKNSQIYILLCENEVCGLVSINPN